MTTLAVVAATAVTRAPTEQGAKAAQSISAAQPLGQFVGLMPGAVVEAPVGHQQVDSAPRAQGIGSAQQQYNPLPLGIGLPIGAHSLDSAPQRVAGGATWDRGSNILFLPVAIPELPIGKQETKSAPAALPGVAAQSSGLTALLLPVAIPELPIGKQETDSAPTQVTQRPADQAPNLVIGLPAEVPVGRQQVGSAPVGPGSGATNQQRNLLTTTLGIGQPVGHQATESAPWLASGVAAWGQGTSALFLPAQPAALPIGHQATDSAPQVVAHAKTWDQGSNTLFLPVAAATANVRAPTFNPLKPAPAIGSAMPQSVPLGLMPVVGVTPIPIGAQATSNQVTTPQVQSTQAQSLLTTTLAVQALPIGRQETRAAPASVARAGAEQAPNLAVSLPVAIPELPVGKQETRSAPSQTQAGLAGQQTNAVILAPQQIAAGIAPLFVVGKSEVSSWVAPNLAIGLVAGPVELPIGRQAIDSSAPLVRNPIGSVLAGQSGITTLQRPTLCLSPYHRALLEGLARAYGLIDPVVVTGTSASDGTRSDGTLNQVLTAGVLTTVSGPGGPMGPSCLEADEIGWLEALARRHGLIAPLTDSGTSMTDGTFAQDVVVVGNTATYTRTS